MFLDGSPLVYIGLVGGPLFLLYVWWAGDWSFASSDIALVECEEEGIDYSQAPEHVAFLHAIQNGLILILAMAFGYILSGAI